MNKLDATRTYWLADFVMGFASKLVFTTYVIYRVQAAGLDALQLVLLGTLMEGTIFVFEIPTGIVADLYSRRLSVIIGIAVMGLGHIIEGVAPIFWVMMLSQFVWGLGYTFISGAFSAWIADEVGVQNVGGVFLRGDQLSLIGNLAAIPLSVVLASSALNLPYFIGGGIYLGLALLLALVMEENGFTPVAPNERQGWHSMVNTFQAGLKMLGSRPALVTFAIIGLFVGLYSEAWDRLAQPYLLDNFAFPNLGGLQLTTIEWFGVLNLVFLLVSVGTNEIAKRRVNTSQGGATLRVLQWVYGGMVVAMLSFTLTGNFYMAVIAMVAFSGLRTVSFSLTNTWINLQIESKVRATVLSMTGQIDAFGELSGGPILGAIGNLVSVQVALWVSTLTLSSTVPLYSRIRRLTSRE